MLHTDVRYFDKENLYEATIEYIKNLMCMIPEESEFLNSFYKGSFHPEYLFPDDIAMPLYSHPMVIRNLQKINGE